MWPDTQSDAIIEDEPHCVKRSIFVKKFEKRKKKIDFYKENHQFQYKIHKMTIFQEFYELEFWDIGHKMDLWTLW